MIFGQEDDNMVLTRAEKGSHYGWESLACRVERSPSQTNVKLFKGKDLVGGAGPTLPLAHP